MCTSQNIFVHSHLHYVYLQKISRKIYLHIGKEQFTILNKIPSDAHLGVLVPQKGAVAKGTQIEEKSN